MRNRRNILSPRDTDETYYYIELNENNNYNMHNDREQWNYEKNMFFKGLKNNDYLIFDDCIAVCYNGTQNSNDPRYIVYYFGDYRLTDDHFSIQHSNPLSRKELMKIFFVMNKEGIDPEQFDIYYEV